MNHDAEFHKSSVDGAASSVDNVYIIFSHGLGDAYARLPNAAAGDFGFGKRQTDAKMRV